VQAQVRRVAAYTLACVLAPQLHAAEAPVPAPAPAAAPAEPAQPNRAFSHWEFEIRGGAEKLGTLVFDFADEGDERVVRRKEALSGRKFLIRFSVDQRTTEHWRGAELQAFEGHSVSKTSLGDEDKRLRVRRGETGTLLAEVAGEAHKLPATAWPATFWNIDFMARDEVFDAGAGRLAKLSAQPQGKESLQADGGRLECARYSVSLSIDKHTQSIAIWYDALGRLCGLRQESGGDVIEYVRVRSK
jgi:hypothetical protein